MMPGGIPPVPAINPSFRNVGQNKPLADRINGSGHRPNGKFHNQKHQQNGQGPQSSQDTEMGDEASIATDTTPANTVCKFNLNCTKPDCIFAHQSPAAPPGIPVDPKDTCTYGVTCQNRKCTAKHPSPAQKNKFQAEQDCKFFPNCTNPNCTFRHPSMPMCRNGGDCTRENCKFTHVRTTCKYNPCMNPHCQYKHVDGQKRGKFGDKVWVAGEDDMKVDHVSERKFIDDQAQAEEELVRPVAGQDGQRQPGGGDAEVAA